MRNKLGEIKVVNKKWFKGEGLHIGEGSCIENFWIVKKKKRRPSAFECEDIWCALYYYEIWLRCRIKNKDLDICRFLNDAWKKVKRGEEVNLICVCKRKNGKGECHGDVIKKIIEEKL